MTMHHRVPELDVVALWSISSRREVEAQILSPVLLKISRKSESNYFHSYECTFSGQAALPAGATGTSVQMKVLRGATVTREHKLVNEAVANWLPLARDSPNGINIVEPIVNQILPYGCIATLLYQQGNLLDYYLQHPGMNARPILRECACTLAYVHEKGIVHGNICANNFLVSDDGHAYLSDIGIHEALRIDNFTSAWRFRRHSAAYMEDERIEITTADDVYAFAMMVYELYSGERPFPLLKDEMRTIVTIATGLPPLTRPQRMPEDLWVLVRRCTDSTTTSPTMEEIAQFLGETAKGTFASQITGISS